MHLQQEQGTERSGKRGAKRRGREWQSDLPARCWKKKRNGGGGQNDHLDLLSPFSLPFLSTPHSPILPRPISLSPHPSLSRSLPPRVSQLKNEQVHKAVVTETAKETRRADGSALVFQRNACVLLSAKLQPLGSRVLGFATHELRARGLMKVLSLAARVI